MVALDDQPNSTKTFFLINGREISSQTSSAKERTKAKERKRENEKVKLRINEKTNLL